ncbi:MAG: DUF3182 family protein [Chloroflexota bacterium]
MKDVLLLENSAIRHRADSGIPINVRAIARRIATMLGGSVVHQCDNSSRSRFFVPFAAVRESLAAEHHILGNGDVYGGVVREQEHADKAILHKLVREDAFRAGWYSPEFALCVSGVTLPGFTVFTNEDAVQSFEMLQDAGVVARCKDPSNTGGVGQRRVDTKDELTNFLSQYGSRIRSAGVVIEAEIDRPNTVSVGRVNLLGHEFCWFGQPYDVMYAGVPRFGGNVLTVIRGGFDELLRNVNDPDEFLAIEQAARVFSAYDTLGAVISRGTLDVVQGISGVDFVSGVTDPSLRPSGSSAAELRAIEALNSEPRARVATTRVEFDYTGAKRTMRPSESVFVTHKNMTVYVDLVTLD